MTDKTQFINGRWLAGKGKKFASSNPATGDEVWQGCSATVKQVDAAVCAARNAFDRWCKTSFEKRADVIKKFGRRLEENRENLARIISIETGKPLWETLTEVSSMIGKIDISIDACQKRTGIEEQPTVGAKSIVRHKPHGVVAVFGPYNFPGHLPNGHIVPALLAGNTVVFKPSSCTPMVAEQTVRLWQKVKPPKGVINLVQGQRETGVALAGHKDIDGLFFTGSSYTGKTLHEKFAGQVQKIIALEMGGNNPLIVADFADLPAAVYHTVQSAYLSAGQRCTCARRLFVPDNVKGDLFIKSLVKAVKEIKVGVYDDKDEPFMGPVISESAADQLILAQKKLGEMGGRSLVPMVQLIKGTGFLSPGLMDVSKIKDLPDEEYFGPFLQLIRYKNFDRAIQMANNTSFGLSAGLFSDDIDRYKRFYAKIRAGIVNWNRPLTGASSAAPFGGIGKSGNHRPSAYYAADYCSFPVASLEAKNLSLPDELTPGIKI
jgi:succinylglutamic semialdehyde dehydrogenase